jgi:uncharacterized protein (DUF2164 family)
MTEFPLKFEKDTRTELVRQFQQYLRDEHDLEPGDLSTELFIEFAGKVLGPHYYNHGLKDALKVALDHAEIVTSDVLSLEKDTNPRK